MTKLNLKQLTADVARYRNQRLRVEDRSGRRSGSMQIIRENLAAIEDLRANSATWVDIAAGLAAQGVVQRDGRPITSKRLTSLIASIRREDARRQAKAEARAVRSDLAGPPPDSVPATRRVSLAAELQAPQSLQPAGDTRDDAEEAIRRRQYETTKSLFKTGN